MMDEDEGPPLLAYVNGDHEYALFNPHGEEIYERKARQTDSGSGLEGTGMSLKSKDHFHIYCMQLLLSVCRCLNRAMWVCIYIRGIT